MGRGRKGKQIKRYATDRCLGKEKQLPCTRGELVTEDIRAAEEESEAFQPLLVYLFTLC